MKTQRHVARGKGHIMTETEIGVTQLQPRDANDCWEPLETGGSLEGLSPGASCPRGRRAHPTS